MIPATLLTRVWNFFQSLNSAGRMVVIAILLGLILIFIFGCNTQQQIVDTTQTQAEARKAAQDFDPHSFPGPGSILTPSDQAKVDNAREVLNVCAPSLKSLTDQANSCAIKFKELQKKYDEEAGFFARMSRLFSALKWIGIAVGVAYILGIFFPHPFDWIISIAKKGAGIP